MELNERIKQIRENHKLNVIQVAEGCGMSASTYRKYENGERGLSVIALQKLADFYKVTTDYLLGREEIEYTTIDQLSSEFNMTALEKKILEGYLELPESMRDDLMEFLQRSVREVQEED